MNVSTCAPLTARHTAYNEGLFKSVPGVSDWSGVEAEFKGAFPPAWVPMKAVRLQLPSASEDRSSASSGGQQAGESGLNCGGSNSLRNLDP